MIVDINHLNVSIAQRTLIGQLNWQINPGECWCIVGRNGVGKTTLLNTLAGLRAIDTGTILLNNKKLASWLYQDLARVRAYLPQTLQDAFACSVLEAVLIARHPYTMHRYWDKQEDVDIARAALKIMDVHQLADRDIFSLSGGERQRVAIATLLAQDTPIMLLDEPLHALDLSHQVSVMKILKDLVHNQHKTIVMTSHDINFVADVATHVLAFMDNGAWNLGNVEDMMQEEILTSCLGYPVQKIVHEDRPIFIARR